MKLLRCCAHDQNSSLVNLKINTSFTNMEESTTFVDPLLVSAELQFAHVLENFQLSGGLVDTFEVVQSFTSIAAQRALAIGQKLGENEMAEPELLQEFESWDLEAKLWHLVHVLYSFRLSDPTELPEYAFSSLPVKRESYLRAHPKIKELLLIVEWLQYNAAGVATSFNAQESSKWTHTRIALENKGLSLLAPNSASVNIVDCLDSDAPLRSQKNISPADSDIDSVNFSTIYKLVLRGDIQSAIDFANETGNYTLAIILVGVKQDYLDPVIDVDAMEDDNEEPSGVQHKYMWLQTVFQLSREPNLNKYERLIYSYLSGGDMTANVKEADGSWEDCLLVYVNQLFTHHMRAFVKSILPGEITSVTFPTPQHSSVDGILNSLLKSKELSFESKNPFRVIMGSIMIDQLSLFLNNTFKSKSAITEDQHILRVLTHLAVVLGMLNLHEGGKTPTKIITRYISKLSESGLEELVPAYLAFIPDEKDARECYSIFLSTITDPEKRAKQLEIVKKFEITATGEETPNSTSTEEVGFDYENKMNNVLKRTVERVMTETEPFYTPSGDIRVEDEYVDPTDVRLYRSVEWLYENKMYEDAVSATRTLVRRFLLTGKLKSLKEFSRNKNFKSLLKDYDYDLHTKTIGSASPPASINEDDKEELMQYELLVECLRLLDEWKQFTGERSAISEGFWKSKDVEKSIEKTILKVQHLVFKWFKDLIASATNKEQVEIYKEYRSIYVPYFIIELLLVLQQSRLHDWKYMRQAFQLVNDVANDKENDFMNCFISCGRFNEFVSLAGEVALVASERGMKGIFA